MFNFLRKHGLKRSHYNHIREALRKVNPGPAIVASRIAMYHRIGVEDPEKNLRKDFLREANLVPWLCDNVHAYATNQQVDDALKRIMIELDILPEEGEWLYR